MRLQRGAIHLSTRKGRVPAVCSSSTVLVLGQRWLVEWQTILTTRRSKTCSNQGGSHAISPDILHLLSPFETWLRIYRAFRPLVSPSANLRLH
ncbi:hypothetical protein M3J09_005233 [Ascochyta lentis]